MGKYTEKELTLIKILKTLDIDKEDLLKLFGEYNNRVKELNDRVYKHAEIFLKPKMEQLEDGTYQYTLSQDDVNILEAYKKQNGETLAKEFPQLFEVMDDLRIFEMDIF